MKNKTRFTTRCFLVTLVVLLTGILSAAVVYAEPYIPKKKVIYQDGVENSFNINLEGVSKTSDVTKLKSSKKSVATVTKFEYMGTAYVSIHPKKAGTTIVTFNVKYKNKTIKAKTTVVIKKYVNPLKTLKIGSKNYASKFKKTRFVSLKKALKGKLSIILKSGYQISSISTYNSKNGSGYKTLKNNKTIKIPKNYVLCLEILPDNAPEDEVPMELEIRVG